MLGSIRDGATLLANVTNIAWFGRSWALPQHLQIARMRAIETARPIVRATNTGTTAAIDFNGRVIDELPVLQAGALDAEVQGRQGLTPYTRTGNLTAIAVAGLALLLCRWRTRRRAGAFSAVRADTPPLR